MSGDGYVCLNMSMNAFLYLGMTKNAHICNLSKNNLAEKSFCPMIEYIIKVNARFSSEKKFVSRGTYTGPV